MVFMVGFGCLLNIYVTTGKLCHFLTRFRLMEVLILSTIIHIQFFVMFKQLYDFVI
jgi:hypothetical protein